MASTPCGVAIDRLAASRITSAPRRRASSASATPILPEERFPTKRTLSSGSRVPPAVIRTRRPASDAGLEQPRHPGGDLRRLGEAPDSPFSLGHLPLIGPDELDTACAERLDVRAGRRMGPHARVHRRCDEHRPAMGERRLGEHVVGDPVRELRQRVRRAGRDDEQIGTRQVRVDILRWRSPREREEGLLGHEALGAGRDERNHLVPGLDQQARQLARLVRRDAARDTQKNPAHAGNDAR